MARGREAYSVWSVVARVAIALTALIVIDSVRFADPDLFVTLYAGRDIAAAHGPPGVDSASFTVAGRPWNDYEWLARLAMYEVARLAGDRGLVIGRWLLAATILATFAAVSARAGGGVPSFAIGIALFVGAASGYLLFRPTFFTFTALVLLLAAIERLRQGARWPLWAIPAAIPLWANLHAGFALGVTLLGLLAVLALAERWVPALRRVFTTGVPWRTAAPCFLASAALTGVHPLGYAQWGAVLGTLGGRFTPSLSEWRPLTELQLGGQIPVYLLMAVLAVAIFTGRKRLAAFDVATALVLGTAAFVRVRFVPLFTLSATLLLLRTLPAFGEGALRSRIAAMRRVRAACAVAAIALAGFVAWQVHPTDLRIRKIPVLTPVSAVKFLEVNGISGRVLAEYDWGGYVRWKIPGATIFVDGRSDTVYPLPVIEEWARFVNAIGDWRDIADRHGAQVVLLRGDQAVVPLLESDAEWIPVYGDPFSRLFIRDVPEHAAFLERLRAGQAVVPAVRAEDYLGL